MWRGMLLPLKHERWFGVGIVETAQEWKYFFVAAITKQNLEDYTFSILHFINFNDSLIELLIF